MFKQLFFSTLLIFTTSGALFSQTVIFEDDFEGYISGNKLAGQSPVWEAWSGPNGGGTDDAYVSSTYASSGSNAMHIVNENDMILPLGGLTTGRYTIEYKVLIAQQGYINVMHSCRNSWAFDLYFNANGQIRYLDQPSSAAMVTVDTYSTGNWIDIRNDIDIDLDSVYTYINNVQVYGSKFSNANTGSPGSILGCMDFYGLNGALGVNNSDYYIDDIRIMEIESTANIGEVQKEIDWSISNNTVYLSSEAPIETITVYDINGRLLAQTRNASSLVLPSSVSGTILLKIDTDKHSETQRIFINQ